MEARILSLLLAVSAPVSLKAGPVVIDFEGLPDSTVVTNQYAGLSFSNTIILSAGISLNEFEFPPHSGVNVASDNGGPVVISFASPVLSVGGYFTYAAPLTLAAFDTSNNRLAAATSAFSNNEALSGDPGSIPNELLGVSSAGISRITITGDIAGGSFVLDDLTYATAAADVPEPTSTTMILLAGICLAFARNSSHRGSSHSACVNPGRGPTR